MRQAPDEYRGRAEVCLSWAQRAPADDVRRACAALAMAWLKAAADQEIQDCDRSSPTARGKPTLSEPVAFQELSAPASQPRASVAVHAAWHAVGSAGTQRSWP